MAASFWGSALQAQTFPGFGPWIQAPRSQQLGPSIIEVPVTISLESLLQELEQRVPVRAGDAERFHGIDIAYGVWRGPLRAAFLGEDLHLQVPIRYWVRGRKKLLGSLKLAGSCGVDEPPREAIVDLVTRLGWWPDWRLVSRTTVFPVRFLNPCPMTAFGIDVTPLIERYARRKLAQIAEEAIDDEVPPLMTDLRPRIIRVWEWLDTPIALGEHTWLVLQPEGVRVAPLHGTGLAVSTVFGLVARPRVTFWEMPSGTPRPLPPLQVAYPTPGTLSVVVQLELASAEASTELVRRLGTEPYSLGGHQVTFDDVVLSGSGSRIVASFKVSGSMEGTVKIIGRPEFDAAAKSVSLKDLDLELIIEDPAKGAMVELLRNPLLRHLEAKAKWSFADQMDDTLRRIQHALNQVISPKIELRTELSDVEPIGIEKIPAGIRLNLLIQGKAQVVFH